MKIGDYVTAVLVSGGVRQGVYIKDNGDGTIQVQGQEELYQCWKGRGGVVPDSNLFQDTFQFVQALRKQLGL